MNVRSKATSAMLRPKALFLVAAAFFAGAAGLTGSASSVQSDPTSYSTEETNAAAAEDLERALRPYRVKAMLNLPTPAFERTQRVFRRVVSAADQGTHRPFDWTLYVHAGRMPEAYSRAGGKIVLSEQFLERYQPGDDELAFVIGHEAVHAICEHERLEMSALWRNNGPQRLSVRDAMELLQDDPFVSEQYSDLVRAQERIADREGLRLAARAGFDTAGAMRFLDKMEQLDKEPVFFAPMHDTPAARRNDVQATRSWLERVPKFFYTSGVHCGA